MIEERLRQLNDFPLDDVTKPHLRVTKYVSFRKIVKSGEKRMYYVLVGHPATKQLVFYCH